VKSIRFLIYIYILSLALSFAGFWIDSDITANSLAYQLFEVIILSFFLSGILTAIYLLLLSFFNSMKGHINK